MAKKAGGKTPNNVKKKALSVWAKKGKKNR